MNFLPSIHDRQLNFLLIIPLTNKHIFYNYCVCLSLGYEEDFPVMLQKIRVFIIYHFSLFRMTIEQLITTHILTFVFSYNLLLVDVLLLILFWCIYTYSIHTLQNIEE